MPTAVAVDPALSEMKRRAVLARWNSPDPAMPPPKRRIEIARNAANARWERRRKAQQK